MAATLSHRDQQRLQRARAAWLADRQEEAIRQYEKLAQRNPNHPSILTELAQCYAKLRRVESADRLLQQLIERHATVGRVMVLVARTYDLMRMTKQAISANRLALKCSLPNDEQTRVHTDLALACERTNELTEAQTHAKHLLKHAADLPTTSFVAGLVASRLGDLSTAQTHFSTAIERGLPTPLLGARARYELAKVLDKQGKFDEAYQSATAAKQIDLPHKLEAHKRSQWVARLTNRLTEHTGPETVAQWISPTRDETSRPVCLITGHPRSGTTLIEQMLDAHPQIASADESSTLLQHIFKPLVGDWADASSTQSLMFGDVSEQQVAKCRDRYLIRLSTLASSKSENDWLIDKNPESMVMLPALQRAAPSARVLVVLRDPRDVCLSCYMQFLPATPVSVNFDTLQNTAAKYARTMNLWLALRPLLSLNWCEIKYEDVAYDPQEQAKAMLTFLDLEWDDSVLEFAQHARTKVIRSPTYQSVTESIYTRSIGRWKNYARQMEPALDILQPFVDAFGYA